MLVKTFLHNFFVTYGLACPVDTLHHTNVLSQVFSNLKSNVEDSKCRNNVNSASRA